MGVEGNVGVPVHEEVWLEREALQQLLDELDSREYETLGPVLRDGAVTLEAVRRIEDLPVGWRDEQGPGRYRVELPYTGAGHPPCLPDPPSDVRWPGPGSA